MSKIFEHDQNRGSPLILGLLWQRRKCAESSICQLFQYFLFWKCISEIISCPYLYFNKIERTYTILVYELWTYRGANIKMMILA